MISHLTGVALQQLVSGAVSLARFSTPVAVLAADAAQGVTARVLAILQSRITDQSARLTVAVEVATDRAWRALELVLTGDSVWDRLKGALAAADVKAFRHDVRGLLAAAGVDGNYPVDRRAAVAELRAARKAGVLQPTDLTPAGMVGSVGAFARFDSPADLAAAQWQAPDAEAVADPIARGEAQMNAYRAALEARDWAGALRELVAAARADAKRFAPFPVGKYVPQRILGAGGFGVAFLCKHKYMDAPVVVKALSGGGERDFEAVFAEARAAAAIQHPGIVRITDCGYVDAVTKNRPFVVMDYFPGRALDDHIREHGPLAADVLVPLARGLAEGLDAAHQKGILHRDVKPGNVLVRPDGDGLEARVIDFGLAVWQRQPTADTPHTRAAKTLLGETIAGTVEYAAPEQMGRSAVRPGPYSDVYGWAKMCCFALFQTAQPTLRHWQGIPAPLADLLGRCLEEVPGHRPQSFIDVIAELDRLADAPPPLVEARVVAVPAE